MILMNFILNEGKRKIGVLKNDDEVVDIEAACKILSLDFFDTIEEMEDLIAYGVEGLKKVKSFLEEINTLEENDKKKYDEIKTSIIHSLDSVKFAAPLYNPQKIICLGRNFVEHAKEGGKEPPKYPMIWGKFNSAIIAHKENIVLPEISEKVDVEIELVAIIGKEGKNIPENKAQDYIFGYTIGNDVSARDCQYSDVQFTRSKTMDTFAPLGPWIVTKEDIANPQNLELELKVNGKTWQKSNTDKMTFTVAYIVSYLSKSFTFKPGDLIFTGTPSGVGHYQNPPIYLKDGDIVTLVIEKIGRLENPVVRE